MDASGKIRASVIGVTGYTGLELLRFLVAHPQVEIAYLTSRQHENVPLGDVYPHLSHLNHLKVTNTDGATVAKNSDVVFLGLPHKTAQEVVPDLMGKTKIIDLSADFRLQDLDLYKKYYAIDHTCPQYFKDFVYGAPEIYRDAIKKANNVANPGCFALLVQLLLLPFKGNIKHADVFAVTGSSGSGKTATDGTHHPVRSHNIKSYNINKHRHTPEIMQSVGISESQLNFVPTSGPFVRGIFGNAFITLDKPVENPGAIYTCHPFVRVQKEVELANIVGSNYCDLSFKPGVGNTVIAQGALDNLVKGAAGCAVQNMNLMFGLPEGMGLDIIVPVYP